MSQTTDTRPRATLDDARAALAREWDRTRPQTAEEILAFYEQADGIADDLHAWHAMKSRQKWTTIVTHVAQQIGAKVVVDIGCGAGYELRALKALGIDTMLPIGVEPNKRLRAELVHDGYSVAASIDEIDVASVDMFVCLDVLEHVVDPESFLGSIASKAKPNTVLVESTATFDVSTPLHLKENRGWHPGHVLELHGWELLDARGRVRVWQRMRARIDEHASVLICAYRSISVPTDSSLRALERHGWRIFPKSGDGLITRARAITMTRWLRETADDVCLMVDDDIVFEPGIADRLVDLCRNGHDIICAAYPVRDGGHIAIRGMDSDEEIQFGDGLPPKEIMYAATGFLAVHRRVVEAIVKERRDFSGIAQQVGITVDQARTVLAAYGIEEVVLPLCHQNVPWSFWPMFDTFSVRSGFPAEWESLSEDYAFCARARNVGFKVWLDPGIRLGHLAMIQLDIDNMDQIYEALRHQREDDDDDEGWL
jgi:SAM-dependent methyltransferase